MVKSPKGYITNNGLISYLTGLTDLSILEKTGLIGCRFENWFLNELLSWQGTTFEHHSIHYWRTATGMEVDFVVIHGNKVVPFEITYSSHIQSKKIRNLISFLHNEPRSEVGIYVYMGDLKFDTENKIIFLPAWML